MTRDEWRISLPQLCMSCLGTGGYWPLEVHEIERRSHAPKSWQHTCNYLLLCKTCHENQFATMPHAEQMAVKARRDRMHFNLDAWLRLRDPDLAAPDRVTIEEITSAFAERYGAQLAPWLRSGHLLSIVAS